MAEQFSPFELIVIGPRGVGKSSVSAHISRECHLPIYCVDARCFDLYMEDEDFRRSAQRIGARSSSNGLINVFRDLARDPHVDYRAYQEQLHLTAIRIVLQTAGESIVDFGSGHGSYDLEPNQRELARLLAPHPVLCLWPSRDPDRAADILVARNGRSLEATKEGLASHRGRNVAKHVLYVEERKVAEVADEAVAWMRDNKASREGMGHGSQFARAAAAAATGGGNESQHRARRA
ncbi:MAG: hypothetical protein EON59_06065 [Alphaproteobacteria bacterium]|nr:MAG: hypothetical protein EON59_06065 [Alphaproteobacteria bacterium]